MNETEPLKNTINILCLFRQMPNVFIHDKWDFKKDDFAIAGQVNEIAGMGLVNHVFSSSCTRYSFTASIKSVAVMSAYHLNSSHYQ